MLRFMLILIFFSACATTSDSYSVSSGGDVGTLSSTDEANQGVGSIGLSTDILDIVNHQRQLINEPETDAVQIYSLEK